MPRNLTGGSAHRSQRNSESAKEKKNRSLVDALLDDYSNGEHPAGVFIGRVVKRMGNGRMDVLYLDESLTPPTMQQKIIPLRGSLTGKGKKDVWIDVDSIIMIHETGLGNATHEIVGVLTEQHQRALKKVRKDMDGRLFQKSTETTIQEEGFEFEAETKETQEVDIDTI